MSGRSSGGGGIATKIGAAISRVVWNRGNSTFNEDDEVQDLIMLIEELNAHQDLAVRLNNQSKLCQLLETNEELNSGRNKKQTPEEEVDPQKNVKEIMQQCKQ